MLIDYPPSAVLYDGDVFYGCSLPIPLAKSSTSIGNRTAVRSLVSTMGFIRFVVVVVAVWFPLGLAHPGTRVETQLRSLEPWHFETQQRNWTCDAGTGNEPTGTQSGSSATYWNRSTTAIATSTAAQGIALNGSGLTSNRKKGYPYNEASYLSSIRVEGVSWAYNWKAQPDGPLPPGLDFIPMCWGAGSAPTCSQDMQAAISSGSAHLFSFNEPDHQSQADMTPEAAAALHLQIFDSLSTSAKIGSPAVTNGPPPMGISWLEQFLDICHDHCPVDFIAFHWYGAAQDLDGLRKHTENIIGLAHQYGISEVWLTEFGAHSGTLAEKVTFLEEAMDFLDSNPSVERYAYFMLSDGILLEGHRLSKLGEVYVETASTRV